MLIKANPNARKKRKVVLPVNDYDDHTKTPKQMLLLPDRSSSDTANKIPLYLNGQVNQTIISRLRQLAAALVIISSPEYDAMSLINTLVRSLYQCESKEEVMDLAMHLVLEYNVPAFDREAIMDSIGRKIEL